MKASVLDNISAFLAELIGTALLLFLGCMGCIEIDGMPNNLLQISITFGMVIMLIIQIFGCVSGAHLNPCVTIAAVVYKLVTPAVAALYFVAQMLGAFIGYGLLKALVSEKAIVDEETGAGLCITNHNDGISGIQAVFIEAIITGVLVWVCCGVWDPRNAKGHDAVPLKFGFTIAALCGAAGHWTGASMNPARSFAPALWHMNFTNQWIYWVGPLLGTVLAVVSYRCVFYKKPVESDEKRARALEELVSH